MGNEMDMTVDDLRDITEQGMALNILWRAVGGEDITEAEQDLFHDWKFEVSTPEFFEYVKRFARIPHPVLHEDCPAARLEAKVLRLQTELGEAEKANDGLVSLAESGATGDLFDEAVYYAMKDAQSYRKKYPALAEEGDKG